MKYIISPTTISVWVNENQYYIYSDHINFKEVRNALIEENFRRVETLLDIRKTITRLSFGNFLVENDVITYQGKPVHNVISNKILEFIREGQNFQPLFKFLENLYQNPSYNSVAQLYSFLEHKNLPITDDGYFLAYKAITVDWKDKWTRKIDNSIGATPSMPRNEVTDDKSIHCGPGLHAGSLEYVKGYGHGTDRFIVVKIHPKDVVSVPEDCSCQKMRTCGYTVLNEYTGPLPEVLQYEEYKFDGDLFDDNDFAQPEYDEVGEVDEVNDVLEVLNALENINWQIIK